ncbi:MAG: M48 family metallopeptidase [Phycisphaerae bacterium]|nr:M48 family metallopeptidase [Phycisphaerae bacterium]
MWELIRANRRKSIILFFVMGLCLAVLGGAIGMFVDSFYASRTYSDFHNLTHESARSAPAGPSYAVYIGIAIALGLWMFQSIIAYFFGSKILLSASGATEVTHDVHPQLFNIVEEMKIAANLPVMPKVYIIPQAAPNAFATGIKPENCAIAVTAGLLSKLNRDELQGVIAHEMSHIINRDVLFMTFSGIMLGSIVLISQVFLRGMLYSGGGHGRRYGGGDSKGGGGWAILIITIVIAILVPILAHLLYYAISRKREYLADASAVRLTRYPEGLASALEVISNSHEELPTANKVTAPMYISNPLAGGKQNLSSLSSTHPPILKRIGILRAMSQGADFKTYQNAYARFTTKNKDLIPESSLAESVAVPLRQGTSAGRPAASRKQSTRDMGDLMRAVNQFAFLGCACGLKMKIPPDFKKPSVKCPRCGKINDLPHTELAAIAAMGAEGAFGPQTSQAPAKPTIKEKTPYYRRQGNDWESFKCVCGNLVQLSPAFSGSQVQCSKCNRKILIKGAK